MCYIKGNTLNALSFLRLCAYVMLMHSPVCTNVLLRPKYFVYE